MLVKVFMMCFVGLRDVLFDVFCWVMYNTGLRNGVRDYAWLRNGVYHVFYYIM